MQYYLAIISAAGSPTGEGWYNSGTVVTIGVQSMVQYSNATRLMFNGWNSTYLGNNPTAQVTVNAPTRILAVWTTQYLITVNSDYGAVVGGGWYNSGSFARASVPTEIDYTNGTRRLFAGWTGDYAGNSSIVTLGVDAPKTLKAQWKTQYLVTFTVSGLPNSTVLKLNLNNVTYNLSEGSSYQTWVQSGTAINPSVNQTLTNGIVTYKFTGWQNSTGALTQGPLAVSAPRTYIASYTSQLSLPPIPGFPIEAIVVGLFLGLLAAAMRRSSRLKTKRFPEKSVKTKLRRKNQANQSIRFPLSS
jgi:hypothetical protein